MNTLILEEIQRQLHIVSGRLTLSKGKTVDDDDLINNANAEVIGIVKGIENIIEHAPMTLGELEQKQFDRATDMDLHWINRMQREAM